jgi:hypothetical protein
MNNKKFILSFIIIGVLIQTFIFILYYLINPEQFYKDSLTEKKFYYTKEFSKKQFNQLKSKEYTLIFGTSQIHMISSDLTNTNILNFHNLYGETGDIKNFLFQLNNIQIKNISRIILLIDLRAGMARNDINLINYSEKSNFPSLSIESVKRIYYDIKNNHNKSYKSFLNNDGSVEKFNSKSHIKYIKQLSGVAKINYNDRLISDLVEINNFTKKNKGLDNFRGIIS